MKCAHYGVDPHPPLDTLRAQSPFFLTPPVPPKAPAQPATGFPWVAASGARALIVGSMPGVASLAQTQYYAHSRNAFWSILEGLSGVPAAAPYEDRLRGLTRAGLALWDVVHRCRRPGSLDANIDPDSIEVNRFDLLFAAHPGLRTVFCNGGSAHRLFLRHALPQLQAGGWSPRVVPLPSTSPAHASLSAAQKRSLWLAALSAQR